MASIRPRLAHNIQDVNLWVRSNCHTAYTKLDEAMKNGKVDEKLQSLNATLQEASIDPQRLLYGFFALATVCWAVSLAVRKLRTRKQAARPRTPDLEKRSPPKAPPREPGGTLSPTSCTQIQTLRCTRANTTQYGFPNHSNVLPLPLIRTGPSPTPSPSRIAPSGTAPSTTSRSAYATCTGTSGSSSTTTT